MSEIEIDDAVVTAVAEKAAESLKGMIPEVPTAEAIADALATKMEKTEKKDVTDAPSTKKTLKAGFADMEKEVRYQRAVKAHLNRDGAAMREYAQYVANAWQEVTKADYQNVGTSADGGALVPDPEFIAEVERLTDEYGTASRLANVRRTDRDSVTLLSGTNEIAFTKTGEATAQNAQKLTYANQTVSLDKYIATLVMTSEYLEDSAIDAFADATGEVARARAKLFDQLVFTDATDGLLYAPDAGEGWKTHTVGSTIADLDWEDLMDSQYKVVSAARRNGRFYMHPTVWNVLRKKRYDGGGGAGTGGFFLGMPNNSVPTPTIDGIPVELVDVMPSAGEITANEPFAVFGDLSRIMIHNKRLLETKVFDSGVVKDAGGSDINLITQDSYAMRATLRAKVQTRFPAAFVIIGTGTVS